MVQTMKTAQRDKCSAGRAKRTAVLSAEGIQEAKQSPRSRWKPHFTPALTERVNIASPHYASPSRETMWRETDSRGVQRTPPFQSTNTSACSSELRWQVDYFREEHLPCHSTGFHKQDTLGAFLGGSGDIFSGQYSCRRFTKQELINQKPGFFWHLLSVRIDEAKAVSCQKAASHQFLSWTRSCF